MGDKGAARDRQVFTDAAQQAAGVIAARQRGDLAGAEALLSAFPDEQARTMGFFVLAELSLQLLADATGEEVGAVAGSLSLDIAATFGA